RSSGKIFLIGVAPDHNSPLPEEFEVTVEYHRHVREINGAEDDLAASLRGLGLMEIKLERWLRQPGQEPALEYLGRMNSLLDRAPVTTAIPGLRFLSPNLPTRYYRGRWVDAIPGDGRFVCRRPQAYGSDLWCY